MSYRTITNKQFGEYARGEALAVAICNPGHVLLFDSDGKVKPHDVAGGTCPTVICLEDDLQGKDLADNYPIGEIVQYGILRSGDEFIATLADGQNAAIGNFLESAGDGTLNVHAAQSAGVVEAPMSVRFMALEAKDMSDSSGADPASARFRCLVL